MDRPGYDVISAMEKCVTIVTRRLNVLELQPVAKTEAISNPGGHQRIADLVGRGCRQQKSAHPGRSRAVQRRKIKWRPGRRDMAQQRVEPFRYRGERLDAIRNENRMRQTVDEKLQSTLAPRLGFQAPERRSASVKYSALAAFGNGSDGIFAAP
jgi:hypothetical protein